MIAQNIKVTTTSGFDDVIIDDYLGPITAHVVVGMNLFKDIFAGLTDIFGGRSKTYQNTLSSINEQVINELRKKAFSLGGNCILSLKIDNDEVSAQGKSMMMVSAIGTVAIANFSKKNQSQKKSNSLNASKPNRISNEYLNILQKKQHYIQASKDDSLTIDDALWEFIKKNRVYELADYIICKFAHFKEHYPIELKLFTKNVFDFFSIISSGVAINCLYSHLLKDYSFEEKNRIINIIIQTKLIDYSNIIDLIKNADFQIQKVGIQLALSNKLNYEKSDIELINNLVNLISNSFPQRGKKTSKKKSLSSKLKEIWICECGKENSINSEICFECKKDIYRFRKSEKKPLFVIEKLTSISGLLTEIMG
ncbi:MAG: YbjQ family protein [Candidatus Cloacimonetes bacterium]|nr:YbjQ family protein [Candidatus Cloacimonadota bacterium]